MAESMVKRLREIPLLQPMASRDFRFAWGGEGISLLGDQIYFVGLTWLVIQLTGSGLAVGSVLMAAAVPRAVFILLGGAMTDRFSPRALLVLSNAVRALVVAAIGLLVFSGLVNVWLLYPLAVVFGLADAFFYPAIATIVPSLVDEDRLEAGNALIRGTTQLSVLIGPGLAGALIAGISTGAAFGLGALSFALSALLLGAMRLPERVGTRPARGDTMESSGNGPVQAREEGIFRSIGAGLRYAWSDPMIRAVLLIVAAIDFAFVGPIEVGLATMADRRFDAGAAAFGAMLSALGGGALIGTLLGGVMGRPRRRGRLMLGLTLLLGTGLALLGLAPSVPVASLLLAVVGVGSGLGNIIFVAWLQLRTDPGMLGRVMSLVMLASVGLSPLSLGIAGAMVDIHATAMFAAAGGLVIAAALGLGMNPALRKID